MERIVKMELFGREYYLAYNGAAMFALMEDGGEAREIIEKITAGNAEAFDALVRSAAVMSVQGNLVRRYMGHPQGPTLTETELRVRLYPEDAIILMQQVIKAMTLGMQREIPEEGDVDLGLRELEKKTN